MFYIESERIRMIPLTPQLLQLLSTDRQAMELSLGLNISNMKIDPFYKNEVDDAMVNFWLPKTLEHQEDFVWYTNWEIILRSNNTSIGGMGFIGRPNERSEVEIGYMIDQQHHNKGYASEALRLLIHWAFSQKNVETIVVHTFEDNLPSRRILAKCGFEEIEKDVNNLITLKLIKLLTVV